MITIAYQNTITLDNSVTIVKIVGNPFGKYEVRFISNTATNKLYRFNQDGQTFSIKGQIANTSVSVDTTLCYK